ncbi:MAG: nucleoside phosphorylase [Polyangia bacterium]|jgi:uridine phosphorylase|nr:nucleoside phosphorylase [Polyangia bacterium]
MSNPRAPILEWPGPGPGIIDPITLYRKRPRIPPRVVLCFFKEVLDEAAAAGELIKSESLRGEGDPLPVYVAGRGRGAIAVARPGISAPFAAAALEELIGLGGRAFLCCGGAGVLDGTIPVGTPIVVTKALRDEGTSYHYSRPSRWARPDRALTLLLAKVCKEAGVPFLRGASWTTDAVFRETPSQIRRRRAEGCLTVEMEAAALFAVARFRGIPFGQILYAGDDVSGPRWENRGWMYQAAARRRLLDLTLEAARKIPA